MESHRKRFVVNTDTGTTVPRDIMTNTNEDDASAFSNMNFSNDCYNEGSNGIHVKSKNKKKGKNMIYNKKHTKTMNLSTYTILDDK